ncbi:MAG: hypothetical protein IJ141_08290 [Lachnospiraceae bacterium]|nr:hypothetical protein [Lachnospiraceae bacterium]
MNGNNEIQINFKDYLIYTLRRWRSIIVVSILLAACVGGLVLIKGIIGHDKQVKEYNEQMEQYEEDYANYENTWLAFSFEVDNLKKKADIEAAYMQDSILIKLDPYNVLTTKVTLMLSEKNSNDNTEGTSSRKNSLLRAYYNSLYEYADWDKVAGLINTKSEYAKELVNIEIDYEGSVINIKVIYPDEGYAYAIIDMLLDDAKKNLSEIDGYKDFDLVTINQSSEYIRDDSLANYINNKIKAYTDSQNAYIKGVSDTEALVEPSKPDSSRLSRKRLLVKTIIIAFVILIFGIVLMFIIYYYGFTRKGIVYSADEFRRITGVYNLGVFDRRKGRKSLIDRAIDKKDKDMANTDSETVYERINLYLENNKDIKNIFLLGINCKSLEQIKDMLTEDNKDKSFNAYDDLKDNEALKALFETDGVILVVERERTMLAELLSDKAFIENNGKKIIGNIVA